MRVLIFSLLTFAFNFAHAELPGQWPTTCKAEVLSVQQGQAHLETQVFTLTPVKPDATKHTLEFQAATLNLEFALNHPMGQAKHYLYTRVAPRVGKEFGFAYEYYVPFQMEAPSSIYRNEKFSAESHRVSADSKEQIVARLTASGELDEGELLELSYNCKVRMPNLPLTEPVISKQSPAPAERLECSVSARTVLNGALNFEYVTQKIPNSAGATQSFAINGGKAELRLLGTNPEPQVSDALVTFRSTKGRNFALQQRYVNKSNPSFWFSSLVSPRFREAQQQASTDEELEAEVKRLAATGIVTEGELLSFFMRCAVFKNTVSDGEDSEPPAFDLNETVVTKLSDTQIQATTAPEIIARLDDVVLETISKFPISMQDDLRLSYLALVKGEGGADSLWLTPRVSIRNYLSTTNVLGYAIGLTKYEPFYINQFEIFVNRKLNETPLLFRFTIIHELFGHFAQYLPLLEKNGPGDFGKRYYYMNGAVHPVIEEFWSFTHTTAGLMEWQTSKLVPRAILEQEIDQSSFTEKEKTSWKKYIARYYEMAPRDFVKYKALKERCGGEECIEPYQFENYFKHFRALGFSEF